ncbi:uncharacterized protein Triagg1_6222 [Trichoderma aggressivum f. europaeum]|uniref:BZIP-type transcription factor n=1 Tax=Trichoderma aggressivum f. europaeum TaxID=173218 RepID=A0AAE1ID16_9HYPO|nr:hypothetical protein Triagg1_6222 [Trichoderma aggressivum f. europaeum]
MSSSLSPEQLEGGTSRASTEGTDKGVLSSLNLNFFKNLSDKKVTRTGNPPKRRGPKPDSKPALTRRQELNRQAQRTHRERKELYIKALEDEVLRLKEVFSTISQDKQKLVDENKQLKEVLVQRGIQVPRVDDSASSAAQAMSVSASGISYAPGSSSGFSPVATSHATSMSMSPDNRQQSPAGSGADLEQAVTLDRGCHFTAARANTVGGLMRKGRASDADGAPCGHALMASCPPAPFQDLTSETPFGNAHTHDHGGEFHAQGQGTWELTKADLSTLLDLSRKLSLDGEITPVMAWGMVLSHSRFAELEVGDFEKLSEELLRKVRCYGFGAVLEEFELRDAIENIFSGRPEAMVF